MKLNSNTFSLDNNLSGQGTLRFKPRFLDQLFGILENGSLAKIIAWNIEGTVFTILNQEKFNNQVLPSYYSHNNPNSFVRQLNMYGFKKLKNQHAYYHPDFQRGRKDLLSFICRKRVSKHKQEENVIDNIHIPNLIEGQANRSNQYFPIAEHEVERLRNDDVVLVAQLERSKTTINKLLQERDLLVSLLQSGEGRFPTKRLLSSITPPTFKKIYENETFPLSSMNSTGNVYRSNGNSFPPFENGESIFQTSELPEDDSVSIFSSEFLDVFESRF